MIFPFVERNRNPLFQTAYPSFYKFIQKNRGRTFSAIHNINIKIRYSTNRDRKEHDEGGQKKQENIEDKSHFVIQKESFQTFFLMAI